MITGADDTLLTLLEEYKEEYAKGIKIIDKLSSKQLSSDQIEELLGELSASITHTKIHAEQLEQYMDVP